MYRNEGSTGIEICDSSLDDGCYHELIIASISDNGLQHIPNLFNYCIDVNKDYPDPCGHAIGHALLQYFGEHNLIDALDNCQQLSTQNGIRECERGTLMEFITPGVLVTELTSEAGNTFLAPCDTKHIPEEYKQNCHYSIPRAWTGHFDKTEAERVCKEDVAKEYTNSCLEGLEVMR